MTGQGRLRRLGVGSDTAITTVLQIVAALLAFVVQLQVVRTLTQTDVGGYYLTTSFIAIAASIADFGIVAVIFPRLSVSRGPDKPALKAAVVLRVITFALGLLGINAYLLIRGDAGLTFAVTAGYCAVLFSARMGGIRQVVDLLWRLEGRTYITGIMTVVEIGIQVVLISTLHYFDRLNLLSVMTIITVATLPGFILMIVPMWGRMDMSGQLARRLPERYYRTVLIAALPIMLMGMFGQLSSQLETLVVDRFMTLNEVAVYGIATRPLTSIIFIAMAISFGVAPVVSQIFKSMRRDVPMQYIISVTVRVVCVVSLLVSIFCNLFAVQIMRIFGPQYIAHAHILKLYTVISAGTFLIVFFDQMLIATGRRNQALYGSLLFFSVAIVLEFVLIGSFGIVGMMSAKLAAMVCLMGFQLYCLGPEIRRGAFQGLIRVIPPGAAAAATLILTDGQGTLGGLAFRIPVVVAATGIAVLVFRTITASDITTLRNLRIS